MPDWVIWIVVFGGAIIIDHHVRELGDKLQSIKDELASLRHDIESRYG